MRTRVWWGCLSESTDKIPTWHYKVSIVNCTFQIGREVRSHPKVPKTHELRAPNWTWLLMGKRSKLLPSTSGSLWNLKPRIYSTPISATQIDDSVYTLKQFVQVLLVMRSVCIQITPKKKQKKKTNKKKTKLSEAWGRQREAGEYQREFPLWLID